VTKDIDRDGLLDHLQSKNVPCAIYYPVPMHMQKAYLDTRYKEGDLPLTEHLSRTVISLPMHTELDEEQIAYIAGAVVEYADSH
jgi:dTDP-4-amino-4,6-dideoxygalactose transaminase